MVDTFSIGRFDSALSYEFKFKIMKVTIITSHYECERISTEIVDFGFYEGDRYRDYKDDKYKSFLKKHGFTPSKRVYDLYLRLCGAGLV